MICSEYVHSTYTHSLGLRHMLLLFFCVILLSFFFFCFIFLHYTSDFSGLCCSVRGNSESLNNLPLISQCL